jgi:hypothetical protein
MVSIRTMILRIAIATALAAGAALAGAAAVHHAETASHGAISTFVRPSGIVYCCD